LKHLNIDDIAIRIKTNAGAQNSLIAAKLFSKNVGGAEMGGV